MHVAFRKWAGMEGGELPCLEGVPKQKPGRRLQLGVWEIGNLPISRRFPVIAEEERRLTSMRTGVILACNFQALHFGLQGSAL